MTPLSADSTAFQCAIPRKLEERIRYARTFARHLPSGDLAALLELFVEAYIEKQERKKFGATSRPGRGAAARIRATSRPR